MKTNAISIVKLKQEYGTVVALEDLSLEVAAGSIFGFLGPNGAGKTTTIHLLLGLLQPTAGTVTVLGYDSQSQADQIRSQTGALLEHTGIYEQMSALNNLEFYGRVFRMPEKERVERIRELFNHMGLWERRNERAGNWSKGMKQKLALARTLLHRPKLVLLDEPTAGLDVRSAVSIREDLQSLAENEDVTIFITTHNMEEAEKLCDQVAVVQAGKLVAQGTPDDLRAHAGNFHIEITGRGFNNQALESIRKIPEISNLKSHNSHLTIDLVSDIDLSELVRMMVANGVQVEEVQRSKASLEKVFLELTGENND